MQMQRESRGTAAGAGRRRLAWASMMALVIFVAPTAAYAYIGPGAGFALVGSFTVLLVTLVVAVVAIFAWPFRAVWRWLVGGNRPTPWIRRLIIVGFDGQDPKLTERYMAAGKLPNFTRLREIGGYRTLATSFPSISPVAWSSFATGTEPARHNIYDFLDRDRRTYLPKLSSTAIGKVDRVLKIGRWRIPLARPALRLLRKSKPLWSILGESGIWSTVLRVPITFPPETFHGAQLSAMCAPDLHGTQGTFQLYSTRRSDTPFKEGGVRIDLPQHVDVMSTTIRGPENSFLDGSPAIELPMSIELDRAGHRATVRIDGGEPLVLVPDVLSGWTELAFRAAPLVTISGIARLMVTELDDEHFSLYMTPINIDPERPAMPISHPSYYAAYLAKRNGHFCTVGMAEDTWALNERVIDDGAFLRQAYDIDREREQMFFTALDRLRTGMEVCVFDATDRIQHLFWRYEDVGHPARVDGDGEHRDAIEQIYRRNDELVGKAMSRLRKGDVLLVMSDHGFASFRRGVNVNVWLRDNGYLTLQEGKDGRSEWLRDVDWSRTKAYALGLSGLYLNLEGREGEGIVAPGAEADALKEELRERLSGLRDDAADQVGIVELFDTRELYRGPYIGDAPDLIVGYNAGYRSSWDSASGVIAGPVFEDNTRPWSGDHCIDPRLVPGVLFANVPIDKETPSLIDIAPSALKMFGLEPPDYMEGTPLFDRATIDRALSQGATND